MATGYDNPDLDDFDDFERRLGLGLPPLDDSDYDYDSEYGDPYVEGMEDLMREGLAEILGGRTRGRSVGCANGPTGGYDCHFVEDLPDSLQCLICTMGSREPQQLDCCGKIFCKSCISKLKMSQNRKCPNCRSRTWKQFPDKKSKCCDVWLMNYFSNGLYQLTVKL